MQNTTQHNAAQAQAKRAEMERRPTREETPIRLAPAVDIYENRDEILLVAEMPGANKDDLRVDFANDTLTMRCPRHLSETEGVSIVGELRPAEYHRAFFVPKGIDVKMISAELKDGVLRIHLPKSDAVKPRQIEVRAG